MGLNSGSILTSTGWWRASCASRRCLSSPPTTSQPVRPAPAGAQQPVRSLWEPNVHGSPQLLQGVVVHGPLPRSVYWSLKRAPPDHSLQKGKKRFSPWRSWPGRLRTRSWSWARSYNSTSRGSSWTISTTTYTATTTTCPCTCGPACYSWTRVGPLHPAALHPWGPTVPQQVAHVCPKHPCPGTGDISAIKWDHFHLRKIWCFCCCCYFCSEEPRCFLLFWFLPCLAWGCVDSRPDSLQDR